MYKRQNLCSGSVRQLNNEITARRNVKFFAFTLVKADGAEFENSRMQQLSWLEKQGFEAVSYTHLDVYKRQIIDCIVKKKG